jgi:hypothetical protein
MMETEKKLSDKIVAITSAIREKHPELIPFLDEMPATIPDEKHPEMNAKVLEEYYNSLVVLLKKYDVEHPL